MYVSSKKKQGNNVGAVEAVGMKVQSNANEVCGVSMKKENNMLV